jgi:hypothetical protein
MHPKNSTGALSVVGFEILFLIALSFPVVISVCLRTDVMQGTYTNSLKTVLLLNLKIKCNT